MRIKNYFIIWSHEFLFMWEPENQKLFFFPNMHIEWNMIACFPKDDFFFVTKKHKMNLKYIK